MIEGYGQWAETYRRNLWTGVLPLRANSKSEGLPGGYTGRKAGDRYPDDDQIARWVKQYPGGNLCLRMPSDVIGIDVDDYEYRYQRRDPDTKELLHLPDGSPDMVDGVKTGNITLGGLEDELGELPATWRSSSRGDGPSGIRFYRVPPGLLWGDFGLHLEGIWWGHRYAVVWPSVNPDSGLRYLWINDTEDDPEWGCPPPKVTDLPDLPASWVARFGRGPDTPKPPAPGREVATVGHRGAGAPPDPDRPHQFTREQAARYVETEGLEPLRAAPHGTINNRINDAAVVLSHFVPLFYSPTDAQQMLWRAARTAGYDDMPSALKTIDSGLSVVSWVAELVSEPARPPGGARTRPRDHEDDGWPTETPDDTPPEAAGFWDARPALSHIRDYAALREANPWAVLGATLTRVIAATEPNLQLPGAPAGVGDPASLNMFVALVGKSGGGKTTATKVSKRLLDARTGYGRLETFEAPLGSGEGLAHVYMKPAPKLTARSKKGKTDEDSATIGLGGLVGNDQPIQHRTRALIKALEIDALDAIGQRRGSTLSAQLRTAWDGDELGFHYANADKRLMVPEMGYRMCLILGVQPSRADGLMDESSGGLPQRFLWLPARPNLPDYDEEAEEQAEEPDDIPPLEWHPPAYSGGLVLLGYCRKVTHAVKRHHRDVSNGKIDDLEAHGMLNRLKIAAALAMLLGTTPGEQVMIDEEIWALSEVLMTVSDRTRNGVTQHLREQAKIDNERKAFAEARKTIVIGETVENDGMKKTARWLRGRIGDEWVTEQALRGKIKGVLKKHLSDALDELATAGEIEAGEYLVNNRTARHVRRRNT